MAEATAHSKAVKPGEPLVETIQKTVTWDKALEYFESLGIDTKNALLTREKGILERGNGKIRYKTFCQSEEIVIVPYQANVKAQRRYGFPEIEILAKAILQEQAEYSRLSEYYSQEGTQKISLFNQRESEIILDGKKHTIKLEERAGYFYIKRSDGKLVSEWRKIDKEEGFKTETQVTSGNSERSARRMEEFRSHLRRFETGLYFEVSARQGIYLRIRQKNERYYVPNEYVGAIRFCLTLSALETTEKTGNLTVLARETESGDVSVGTTIKIAALVEYASSIDRRSNPEIAEKVDEVLGLEKSKKVMTAIPSLAIKTGKQEEIYIPREEASVKEVPEAFEPKDNMTWNEVLVYLRSKGLKPEEVYLLCEKKLLENGEGRIKFRLFGKEENITLTPVNPKEKETRYRLEDVELLATALTEESQKYIRVSEFYEQEGITEELAIFRKKEFEIILDGKKHKIKLEKRYNTTALSVADAKVISEWRKVGSLPGHTTHKECVLKKTQKNTLERFAEFRGRLRRYSGNLYFMVSEKQKIGITIRQKQEIYYVPEEYVGAVRFCLTLAVAEETEKRKQISRLRSELAEPTGKTLMKIVELKEYVEKGSGAYPGTHALALEVLSEADPLLQRAQTVQKTEGEPENLEFYEEQSVPVKAGSRKLKTKPEMTWKEVLAYLRANGTKPEEAQLLSESNLLKNGNGSIRFKTFGSEESVVLTPINPYEKENRYRLREVNLLLAAMQEEARQYVRVSEFYEQEGLSKLALFQKDEPEITLDGVKYVIRLEKRHNTRYLQREDAKRVSEWRKLEKHDGLCREEEITGTESETQSRRRKTEFRRLLELREDGLFFVVSSKRNACINVRQREEMYYVRDDYATVCKFCLTLATGDFSSRTKVISMLREALNLPDSEISEVLGMKVAALEEHYERIRNDPEKSIEAEVCNKILIRNIAKAALRELRRSNPEKQNGGPVDLETRIQNSLPADELLAEARIEILTARLPNMETLAARNPELAAEINRRNLADQLEWREPRKPVADGVGVTGTEEADEIDEIEGAESEGTEEGEESAKPKGKLLKNENSIRQMVLQFPRASEPVDFEAHDRDRYEDAKALIAGLKAGMNTEGNVFVISGKHGIGVPVQQKGDTYLISQEFIHVVIFCIRFSQADEKGKCKMLDEFETQSENETLKNVMKAWYLREKYLSYDSKTVVEIIPTNTKRGVVHKLRIIRSDELLATYERVLQCKQVVSLLRIIPDEVQQIQLAEGRAPIALFIPEGLPGLTKGTRAPVQSDEVEDEDEPSAKGRKKATVQEETEDKETEPPEPVEIEEPPEEELNAIEAAPEKLISDAEAAELLAKKKPTEKKKEEPPKEEGENPIVKIDEGINTADKEGIRTLFEKHGVLVVANLIARLNQPKLRAFVIEMLNEFKERQLGAAEFKDMEFLARQGLAALWDPQNRENVLQILEKAIDEAPQTGNCLLSFALYFTRNLTDGNKKTALTGLLERIDGKDVCGNERSRIVGMMTVEFAALKTENMDPQTQIYAAKFLERIAGTGIDVKSPFKGRGKGWKSGMMHEKNLRVLRTG